MLWSKSENLQFFETFYSFLKKIDKKEQIQNFYWLIINSLSPMRCWQQHLVLNGAEPPAVYPHGQSVQKTTLFWRKLNELSRNVSFDSEFTLAFEIKPFKIAFFLFFFNVNFSKYSGAEWVKTNKTIERRQSIMFINLMTIIFS